jgi:transcriptional regulator with XRE-family HTH domain
MHPELLKAELALKKVKVNDLAKRLSISLAATSRKLNGRSHFTQREIAVLYDLLELSPEKAVQIFFGKKVS